RLCSVHSIRRRRFHCVDSAIISRKSNGGIMIANNSSNIAVATVTLTSTQLKALDSVPILIIPSQGSGSIIAPISVQAKFVCPTGEAFTITNDISLLVTDLSGQSY